MKEQTGTAIMWHIVINLIYRQWRKNVLAAVRSLPK
jgi:hypothetical protein